MAAVLQRPLRGSRISTFYPVKTLPSLSSLDSAFQLQEYISLLIRLNVHDVETITSLPGKGTKDKDLESSEAEEQKTEEKDEKAKGDVAVDESCWIYEQLRRLAQDLTHPLITMLQTECSRSTCPEMKAGEWLYLCVAHGEGGAMEQCCAIDYILHTLDSATALLNSPRAFPSRLQIPQSSNRHFSSLARRLSRIFAHAYFHHREIFEQAEAESSLYARFLALTSKFELVPAEFLVIPFRGSGDEDEAGSRGRDSPPRGLDPQQQQQQQAGRPAHPSHTPALWGQSLSSAGGGTFIRPKNRGDPPGLSGSNARKVRARTDTMVHSEAANVAEELARFESEEGDAFQVSSPSSGSGGFEETGRRGEGVVDEPEEVGEREREKEKEVLSTFVVKTIEIPEAPQASASTTEAGAMEAEVTEESKSAASSTSAGGVEQEPSETSTAVSEDQSPPAPAEPEPEPPLSLDAEPEPEPEPQPQPQPELEEKPKPRAEPMIQIVIEPGTDLPPRPPGSSSRVGDVDDGHGDGTTTASPLDEAGVIEDDEDGEEDEEDEEEVDEGEEGEGEDEEEHGKAGSGTPALSLTPAPAPAPALAPVPAPALTPAPDEQARSGESAGSADSLGVEDQLGQAPVSPVVESAGADADADEGEDEDGDKGENEYEVVEKENEKGKEEATAVGAESAVKPGPGPGPGVETETQTETTGEVGASSMDALAATTTTTAATAATAPAPGSIPETATSSSNKKEKDESGSESVSTDS
ncbi:hypothetical protein AX16_009795 [Volvariella volvacea WC 439]|nr:hypothetical protein AX16_009795 [Volvariella volvacea WC 439]